MAKLGCDAGARGRTVRFRGAVVALAAATTVAVGCTAGGGGVAVPSVQPHVVVDSVDGAGRGTLVVDGCTLLGPDSVFTQRIDQLPTGDQSSWNATVAQLGPDGIGLRAGASTQVWQNSVTGQPLNTVTGHRSMTVGTSDQGYSTVDAFWPATGGVNWEGEPNAFDGDRHLMVLDGGSCTLQEHSGYNDVAGTSADLVQWSTPIRGDAQPLGTSGPRVDAAGMPIAPLVYRFKEVYPNGTGSAGAIEHALRIVIPKDLVSTSFLWPANGSDGTGATTAIKMGARLRLKQSAVDRVSDPGAKAVLTALHRYGAVVADSSAPTSAQDPGRAALNGEFNPGWPASFLAGITSVSLSDFEYVDVGACWSSGTGGRLTVAPTPPTC